MNGISGTQYQVSGCFISAGAWPESAQKHGRQFGSIRQGGLLLYDFPAEHWLHNASKSAGTSTSSMTCYDTSIRCDCPAVDRLLLNVFVTHVECNHESIRGRVMHYLGDRDGRVNARWEFRLAVVAQKVERVAPSKAADNLPDQKMASRLA